MESDRQSEAAADKESRTMQITDTNLPKTVIKGAKLNWSDYYVTYKDKDGKDVKVTLSDGMVSIDYEKFEEQKAEINVNNGSVYLYHKLTVLNSTIISSVEDLKSIANDPKGTYLLDSDIDLSGTEWTPIAGFEGKLIGNGHTIKNLTITKLTAKNAGLFDTIGEKATVSDLKLENVSISFTSSAESVGALAGILKGSVENITVTGKIESVGSSAVGGVIGATGYIDSVIGNCSFDGTVIGGNGVGGILGGSDSSRLPYELICKDNLALSVDSEFDGMSFGSIMGITAACEPAKQAKLEKVIAAKAELEAAALQLKTAQAEASAALALAESDRQVIAAGNSAEVEILKRNITAYGGGEAYLRGKLYEKIAPNLQSVMSNSVPGSAFGLPLLNKQPAAVQK
jgi:hypothetical protein